MSDATIKKIFAALVGLCAFLSLSALLFHIFTLTQDFHINENIFGFSGYNLSNFWRSATVTYWSPTFVFLQAIVPMLPAWGPYSHLEMIALVVLTAALIYVLIKKRLELGLWPAILVIGFFFSHPSITEGTNWVSGSHAFVSMIWLLAALCAWPKGEKAKQGIHWIWAALFLVCAFGSPLAHIPVILIWIYVAVLHRKDPQVRWVCYALFLVLVTHVGIRNYLLNGSPFDFSLGSPGYNVPKSRDLNSIASIVAESIEFSQPLILFQRIIEHGRITEGVRNPMNLYHLAWMMWLWTLVIGYFKKPQLFAIFLIWMGATLTLSLQNQIVQRYYPPLILANCVLIGAAAAMALKTFKSRNLLVLATILNLFLLVNLFTKVKVDLFCWVNNHRMEQNIMAIASRPENADSDLIFLTFGEIDARENTYHQHHGGTDATIFGLRRMLQYSHTPNCIFLGVTPGESKLGHDMLSWQNSEINSKAFGIAPGSCQAHPRTGKAKCWIYDNSRFPWGGLAPYQGKAVVPVKFYTTPEQDDDEMTERDDTVQCL